MASPGNFRRGHHRPPQFSQLSNGRVHRPDGDAPGRVLCIAPDSRFPESFRRWRLHASVGMVRLRTRPFDPFLVAFGVLPFEYSVHLLVCLVCYPSNIRCVRLLRSFVCYSTCRYLTYHISNHNKMEFSIFNLDLVCTPVRDPILLRSG